MGQGRPSARIAEKLQYNLTVVRPRAVLHEINPLPGSEQHVAAGDRDVQGNPGDHGLHMRRLTVTRLKLIGYQVLEASDGPKALDILSKADAVDLVFTDLIMPGGMSGREVAVRARELKPGVKVLLTSGYSEELVYVDDLEREQLKVLRKPYHQSDLVAALRDVLTASATPDLR